MFQSYFRIALRVFRKNKVYVAINLLNLGFALACFLLAYLNYKFRNNFDSHFFQTENLYRLNTVREIEGAKQNWGITPSAAGPAIKEKYPAVQSFARLTSDRVVLRLKGNVLDEEMHYADGQFLSFFNFPLKEGNYNQFGNINTVVISEAMANKYFGKANVIGEQVTLMDRDGKESPLIVAGVMQNMPVNSSFKMDLLCSFDRFIKAGTDEPGWRNPTYVTTFLKLASAVAIPGLEQQINSFVGLHNQVRPDWKIAGFHLQPFRDIAFSSDIDMGNYVYQSTLQPNPRGVLVIVPVVMSILILLISCFNFTNISIAIAGKRLKEIGVRKVMGGSRAQLIKQFLIENLMLCLVASLLAVMFVGFLLPQFNSLLGLELRLNLLTDLNVWLVIIGLPVCTAIVAGIYPSFYISSFQPTKILKGDTVFGPKSRFTRLLLFGQFGLSCLALIIGILLSQNAAFQQRVDFGYAINETGVVEVQSAMEYSSLRNALAADPRITHIGGAAQQIASSSYTITAESDKTTIRAQIAHVGGQAYLDAMGIKLKKGRHFLSADGLDKEGSVIVNETMAAALGIEDLLSKQIKIDESYYTIVGVVNDYKEAGLHGLVPPCILRLAGPEDYNYLAFRAKPEVIAAVYKSVQEIWSNLSPGVPFRGFLQTDVIAKDIYLNKGFRSVAFFLAHVTILLSASGLFALVSLNILRRSKEVGMRKVLGASVTNIMRMIGKDFVYLLLAAFAFGSILGYMVMDKIVFRFIYAYHPPIGPGSFIAALLVLMSACMLTVGYRIFRAARMNPISVLRKT
jgi:ABC-type antimicrobial peptide transport system permease subunit